MEYDIKRFKKRLEKIIEGLTLLCQFWEKAAQVHLIRHKRV